jgi:hypothetical protein
VELNSFVGMEHGAEDLPTGKKVGKPHDKMRVDLVS